MIDETIKCTGHERADLRFRTTRGLIFSAFLKIVPASLCHTDMHHLAEKATIEVGARAAATVVVLASRGSLLFDRNTSSSQDHTIPGQRRQGCLQVQITSAPTPHNPRDAGSVLPGRDIDGDGRFVDPSASASVTFDNPPDVGFVEGWEVFRPRGEARRDGLESPSRAGGRLSNYLLLSHREGTGRRQKWTRPNPASEVR